MATKIGPSDTVNTTSMDFIQNAFNTGALQAKFNQLQEASDVNPENDDLKMDVWNLFTDISEEKSQCEFLLESLKSLDKKIASIFQLQGECINETLSRITLSAMSLKDKVIKVHSNKIERQFEKAIEKLNILRSKTTDVNFNSVEQEISDLANRVQDLRLLENHCFSTLDDKIDLTRLDQFTFHLQRLEKLIAVYAPDQKENLFLRLKIACQCDKISQDFQEKLQKEFDEYINITFSSEFISALDHKIYELATEPKDEKNWGKLHRYDDLNRFKHAFSFLLFEDFEKNLKKQISEEEFSEFYKTVFQKIYGPKNVHPRSWILNEFPLIIEVVDAIFQKKNRKNIPF